MILRRSFLIFMTLLIIGCSKPGGDTGSVTTPAVSQKRANNIVTINPDNATVLSVIILTADLSLLGKGNITWYINGVIDESSIGQRFTSPNLEKGDIVQAVVSRNKKQFHSNKIRIRNTPPRIRKAELVPSLPRAGSTISLDIDAEDVDNDTIYYGYKWIINGVYVSDESFLNAEFKRDDMITVEITPHDSDGPGSRIVARTKIYNSLPVVNGSTPVFDGKTYTYDLNAIDADGDILSYKVLDGPEGMSIDHYGVVTWEMSPEDTGIHNFTFLVSDYHGGDLIVPVTARIGLNRTTYSK